MITFITSHADVLVVICWEFCDLLYIAGFLIAIYCCLKMVTHNTNAKQASNGERCTEDPQKNHPVLPQWLERKNLWPYCRYYYPQFAQRLQFFYADCSGLSPEFFKNTNNCSLLYGFEIKYKVKFHKDKTGYEKMLRDMNKLNNKVRTNINMLKTHYGWDQYQYEATEELIGFCTHLNLQLFSAPLDYKAKQLIYFTAMRNIFVTYRLLITVYKNEYRDYLVFTKPEKYRLNPLKALEKKMNKLPPCFSAARFKPCSKTLTKLHESKRNFDELEERYREYLEDVEGVRDKDVMSGESHETPPVLTPCGYCPNDRIPFMAHPENYICPNFLFADVLFHRRIREDTDKMLVNTFSKEIEESTDIYKADACSCKALAKKKRQHGPRYKILSIE